MSKTRNSLHYAPERSWFSLCSYLSFLFALFCLILVNVAASASSPVSVHNVNLKPKMKIFGKASFHNDKIGLFFKHHQSKVTKNDRHLMKYTGANTMMKKHKGYSFFKKSSATFSGETSPLLKISPNEQINFLKSLRKRRNERIEYTIDNVCEESSNTQYKNDSNKNKNNPNNNKSNQSYLPEKKIKSVTKRKEDNAIKVKRKIDLTATTTTIATISKDTRSSATNKKNGTQNSAQVKTIKYRRPNLKIKLPPLHNTVKLTFWGNMIAGAISRSCAQTCMHPANVIKTLLQTNGKEELNNLSLKLVMRGAGAQFLLSLPHGAFSFAVVEYTKQALTTTLPAFLNKHIPNFLNTTSNIIPSHLATPTFDFVSSAVSTTICSIISTPQMVLTDNIMAGYYPNLFAAVSNIVRKGGVGSLYTGWSAALLQKIPSYGLTWVFFQQLKEFRNNIRKNAEATNIENFCMGAGAAAATVCIMIPVDTIKTRIVTQAANPNLKIPYKGIIDCFVRVTREEGIGAFYSSLTPRLISVVPMIGIQFGVYELMKKTIVRVPLELRLETPRLPFLDAPEKKESNRSKTFTNSSDRKNGEAKSIEDYLDEFVEDSE